MLTYNLDDHYSIKILEYAHEVDEVMPIVKEAYLHSPYAAYEEFNWDFSFNSMVSTVDKGLYSGIVLILTKDDEVVGVLGAMVSEDGILTKKMANELVWYVKDGHGLKGFKLVQAYEEWAQKVGIKYLVMSYLTTDKSDTTLDKLYKKKGFTLYEKAYMKELEN